MKIPNDENRFILAGSTDLYGNILATRNIDFDEEGYLKLSDASISIKTENGDTDFDTPIGFGIYSQGFGILSTIDSVYDVRIYETYNITKDTSTNTPTGGVRSHAIWWQDAWYQTQSTSLVRATSLFPTWSTSLLSLTSGVNHPLCVFRNRNTLLIGNGSSVIQIDSSHSTSGQSQLTIPSDLEVTSIAYVNNYVVIGTKNKTSNSGSGYLPAYVFIWDGTTSSANYGLKTESTYVIAVSSFQGSSFLVLTGDGQLLKYNGSGFESISALPFYYNTGMFWCDYFPNYIARNGITKTDGEVVYFNIPSRMEPYDSNGSTYLPIMAGGIWCYDPKVGFYHKHSPSKTIPFDITSITSVDDTTDIISTTPTTVPATGTPVLYNANTEIGGLKGRTLYYVIKVANNQFKLAETYTDAMAGTAIDLTTTTTSGQNFAFYPIKDFGQFMVDKTGFVSNLGMGYYRTYGNLISGAELLDVTSSPSIGGTFYANANITIPDLENRGWFITSKVLTPNLTDIFNDISIKFKPMEKDIDKIVIKYKTSDKIGYPIVTPQTHRSNTGYGTWTDSDTFTTSADLSNVSVGDEIEITAGNGSGQTAHVLSASYDTGTWTVLLDEELKYITVSEKFHYMVDNWKKLSEIGSSNTEGYKRIGLNSNGKWIQLKVELRGVGVKIEELQINSTSHLKI